VVFQTYTLGEHTVSLEWDNWTGFTVVAETPNDERLVTVIGTWLEANRDRVG
jgi:hypothetical protein